MSTQGPERAGKPQYFDDPALDPPSLEPEQRPEISGPQRAIDQRPPGRRFSIREASSST